MWVTVTHSLLGVKAYRLHYSPHPVVSVPYRSGTCTYKLQVKISSRTCIHVLPRALRLWISPPCQGGLWCCHVFYGSRPRFPIEVDSCAATCPVTLNLASRLRWAPALRLVVCCGLWASSIKKSLSDLSV
jgi:hypothetical protein